MGTTNTQTNSEHESNNEVSYPSASSIDEFFAETVIFVTGATGFLGKALLEKLLRSCPRVAKIYILIRPKKNLSVNERCAELLKNPVFDRIRSDFPHTLSKIHPVKGDISMSGLGLQPGDRDMLLQRVRIVFHSAATVRFNEPLKIAINLNVNGTMRMLELCKNMQNLVSFVYVSTAYSNPDRVEVKETIYSSQINPYTMVQICDCLDDETMDIIEKALLGKHPNTYTLTKNLAEQIVLSEGSNLPITIVRPSIIGAAYREPFPGWTDAGYGLTGIMIEMIRGTARSIVCNENLTVDIVPIDFVINTLICACWYNGTQQHSNAIKIYNCISSSMNPINWRYFGQLVRKYSREVPTKYILWYPKCTLRTNELVHVIITTLCLLPAFVVDLILRARGCKPIMIKLFKRIDRTVDVGRFFATNEWKFYTGNMTELLKFVTMSGLSKEFDMDFKNVSWEVYLKLYILGIRKYLFKDDMNTLDKARARLTRLYWLHKLIQIVGIYMLSRTIKRVCR